MEDNLKVLDELGGPQHFNHYAWGWTFAGNTPFRRWKRETYRGGISDPLIVHWVKGIQAKGIVRAQVPSSGKTLDFPTKRFSVASPPVNWETVTEKYPPSTVAWQSSTTRSIIQIHAFTASTISHRGLAESIMHVLKVAIREKDAQAVSTVAEENEVILDGKTFYQILADCEMSPVKGVQVKYKILYYLVKGERMHYGITMIALLAYFDQDRPVMDQMVRSFTRF